MIKNATKFTVTTVQYNPTTQSILCYSKNNRAKTFFSSEIVSVWVEGSLPVKIPARSIWPGDVIDNESL